ncbi:MAG: hypothetical protein EBQ94_01255, partial [Flavobacteriales bacterium]|nr:hypothetical protein [Flavobacteriales bacterium]
MKKKILFSLFSLTSYLAYSQPIGSPPPNNASTATLASSAWYRGGNNPVNNANNIFGTRWNSGIYTMTNSVNRMKMNGTVS